jgi:hypothetical protein
MHRHKYGGITKVGVAPNSLPPFKNGMVVGVDVDMDKAGLTP